MPNIDLTNVQESSGGNSYTLEPGGYIMTVIDYEIQGMRKFVRLKFDVAEGPRKGTFANAMWPISDVMSWKEAAQPMLKQKLRVLSESNPGWDAMDAFLNDRWGEFLGKRVGAVVRARMYTRRDGSDGNGCEIAQLCTVEDIETENYSVPGPKDDRKGGSTPDIAPNPPAPQQYAPQYQQAPAPQQYSPQYQQAPNPQQYRPAPERMPWD